MNKFLFANTDSLLIPAVLMKIAAVVHILLQSWPEGTKTYISMYRLHFSKNLSFY